MANRSRCDLSHLCSWLYYEREKSERGQYIFFLVSEDDAVQNRNYFGNRFNVFFERSEVLRLKKICTFL